MKRRPRVLAQRQHRHRHRHVSASLSTCHVVTIFKCRSRNNRIWVRSLLAPRRNEYEYATTLHSSSIRVCSRAIIRVDSHVVVREIATNHLGAVRVAVEAQIDVELDASRVHYTHATSHTNNTHGARAHTHSPGYRIGGGASNDMRASAMCEVMRASTSGVATSAPFSSTTACARA
jgi:hypothetical protein